ncbi:MAG: DUF1761 family protein [Lactococcus hircilactis]
MDFNWPAVLVGMLVFSFTGVILYAPIHAWGRKWNQWSGFSRRANLVILFIGGLFAGFLLSTAMTHIIHTTVAQMDWSWMFASIFLSFLLWLGIYGTSILVMGLHHKHHPKVMFLHLTNGLIAMLMVGITIGLFPML